MNNNLSCSDIYHVWRVQQKATTEYNVHLLEAQRNLYMKLLLLLFIFIIYLSNRIPFFCHIVRNLNKF